MKDNPLGSWSNLKPSLARQTAAIIKAKFLQKFRSKPTIIEILVSFLLIFVASLAYYFTSYTYSANYDPKIEEVGNQSLIDWFSVHGKDVIVVLIPDKPLMHYLIGNTTTLKTAIEGGTVPNSNVTFPGSKYFYFNDHDEMEKEFFKAHKNAVGFEWENIDDDDSLMNPSIKIYIQSIEGNANIDFLLELRNSIIKMIYSTKNEEIESSLNLKTTLFKSDFAHPKVERRSNVYAFTYGSISSLSCIIATIPDLEMLFVEKQSRILAFSSLMGMSESAFWIANFVVSFVICFIDYLAISLILSFWYGMNGNDFSMILIFSVLYIIAEIWFQYFLSTFTHNTASGRWITISLIMLGIATCFLFQFTVFQKETNSAEIVTNMFFIFPISVYQLFVMQGSFASSGNIPLYKWSNMKSTEYSCSPLQSFTMIISDIIIYFVLFLVLNAFLPRKFGSPPFKIKNCFSKKGRKNKEIYETHESDLDDSEYHATVVEVENLSKNYKDINALDNVSFTVKNGEIMLVIGPNGAGKSTLINCLSGIIQSNEGNILINDNYYNPPSIGVCYQEDVLIKSLTIKEHFDLFGAFRGVPPRILNESVNYLSSVLNLHQIKNQRIDNLSGGQKRKLCIALSLLGNPRLLLWDEPTTGVDVPGRLLIWKMLFNLRETTSIVVSHELEEAEFVSSRLLIMNNGKISFCGTSTELKKEYKCKYELRVNIENGNVDPILKLAKEFMDEAEIAEDREDVIRIPDSNKIPDFLFALAQEKEELGVKSYTFSVQQFEDVLMNIVYQ